MNRAEFLGIIAAINALWQPPLQTKAELDIWYGMIGELDHKQAQSAIMALAKTSQFRPTVAQINDTIQEQTGTKRMSASEAWAIARPCCSRYVTLDQLNALPPEISKALADAGRASYLGTLSDEQARKAFMGAWNAMSDTEHREQAKRIGGMKQIGG